MGDNKAFLPIDSKVEKPNNPSYDKGIRRLLQDVYTNQSIIAQGIEPVKPKVVSGENTGKAIEHYNPTKLNEEITIDFNNSKLYPGCLPNDKDIHKVNLSMSDKGQTKDVDQWFANHKIPFNQNNCHYYVDKFLNLNYKPGFVTQGLNTLSQAFKHENIGSPFPTDNTLQKYDYHIYQHAFLLKDIKLQPGDIVCVIDPSKPDGQKEVHSAIVIGHDSHNNAILRQKLNESDPVVDMTAQHFDELELGNNEYGINKQVKIYRKQHDGLELSNKKQVKIYQK